MEYCGHAVARIPLFLNGPQRPSFLKYLIIDSHLSCDSVARMIAQSKES